MKKKLVIIIVIVLVFLFIGGGTGVYFHLQNREELGATNLNNDYVNINYENNEYPNNEVENGEHTNNVEVNGENELDETIINPWADTFYIGEDGLPQYVSGSIPLHDPDFYAYMIGHTAQMRIIFYTVPGEITSLVDEDNATVTDWLQTNINGQSYQYYMPIMLFVQHFEISRADFDQAMEIIWKANISRLERVGYLTESHEPPNADIIFTFDNDIIRHFYRRE